MEQLISQSEQQNQAREQEKTINEFERTINENLDASPAIDDKLLNNLISNLNIQKLLADINDQTKQFTDLRMKANIYFKEQDPQNIVFNEFENNVYPKYYEVIKANEINEIEILEQSEKEIVYEEPFKSMKYVWSLILINCLLFAISGAYLGIYNTMLDHLAEIYKWKSSSDKDFYFGFINSMLAIGACGGCIILPYFKFVGIRLLLIICLIIMIIGNIIAVISQNWAIILGRGLQGICIGAIQSIGVKHVMNLAPTEYKGTTSILLGIYLRIGLIIVFLLGYGLPLKPEDAGSNQYWRFQALFPGLFAIAYLFALLFIYPFDSADVYYQKFKNDKIKQKEQTMKVLNKIYNPERAKKEFQSLSAIYDQPNENSQLKEVKEEEQDVQKLNRKQKNAKVNIWALYTGQYRKAMWLCTMMVIFFNFPSTIVCIVFSKFLIQDAGSSMSMAKLFTILSSIVDLIAVLISLLLVAKLGKRPIILGSAGLTIIVTILFDIFYRYWGAGIKFLVLAQRLVFSSGFDALFWGYFADILPELGCSIIVFLFQFVQFLICQFFLQIYSSIEHNTFLIFAGISFLCFLYQVFFLVETKGLSRAETIKSFA